MVSKPVGNDLGHSLQQAPKRSSQFPQRFPAVSQAARPSARTRLSICDLWVLHRHPLVVALLFRCHVPYTTGQTHPTPFRTTTSRNFLSLYSKIPGYSSLGNSYDNPTRGGRTVQPFSSFSASWRQLQTYKGTAARYHMDNSERAQSVPDDSVGPASYSLFPHSSWGKRWLLLCS